MTIFSNFSNSSKSQTAPTSASSADSANLVNLPNSPISLDTLEPVLKSQFGIAEFRPKQKEVISSVLEGNHTLALLPTGYGKSLCYQVPSQILPGLTLVVSPLIALMQDQVSGLLRKGIVNATVLSSHVSSEEQALRIAGIKAGAYKLVYVAPERFESARFRSMLDSVKISLLVIDEAHCISQWGHDFRPHYRSLSAHLGRLPEAVILALTATATPQVQEDICKILAGGTMRIVHASFDRPNLHFEVKVATDTAYKDRFWTQTTKHTQHTVIVYTSSRKETERVAYKLKTEGIRAGFYHAGMTQADRTRVQKEFENDKLAVIVSTVAFGMGVDKPNIRHVIHYNLPGSLEAYYQEAGRAGRDGKPATCTLLFQAKDVNTQRWLMDKNFPTDAEVHSVCKSIGNAGHEGVRTSELLNLTKVSDSALNSALDLLKHLAMIEQTADGAFRPQESLLAVNGKKIDMTYLAQRRLRDQTRLERIVRYGQEKHCRRKQILNYFGQELEDNCAGCDVCSHSRTAPAKLADVAAFAARDWQNFF